MTNELEERKRGGEPEGSEEGFKFLGFVLLLVYIPALWNCFSLSIMRLQQ